MQVITGTRKDITIKLWAEQLEKYIQRANNSMECFRRFHEADDLEHLIEDCERIIENAQHTKEVIEKLSK